MPKLIAIVGVTGNQGGSVAARFLRDPNYRVRGLTRNPTSPSARTLAAQGVEIVQAELDDVSTLISAFAGASLIFSVTNYWEPFFRPDCRQKALEAGISCRKYAYDVELQQGRNIAEAAAHTAHTLDGNGFIASTLSHAGRCSGGKMKDAYHFDAKADVFPDHVVSKYPQLAAKMSCVQTGYFTSSYKLLPGAWFGKAGDGTYLMRFPNHPDVPVPFLDVNADTGNFVYAVSQLPPGKSYMAEGTTCSWSEYMRLVSQFAKVKAEYKQISIEELVKLSPDEEFAREVGIMFEYSSEPGYDGGDKELLKADDIRKMGAECPMTSLKDWMGKADWSTVLP